MTDFQVLGHWRTLANGERIFVKPHTRGPEVSPRRRSTAAPTMHTFTVTGQGLFPFDMLRYDICYPKSEGDSAVIEHTTRRPRHPDDRLPKRVTLVSVKAPTVDRWKSFGWTVEEPQAQAVGSA